MRVYELLELLKSLESDMEVKIAYQPSNPLTSKASHLKVCKGIAYICESNYGDNGYAPTCLFDDNQSDISDMGDEEAEIDEDDWED